MESSGSGTTKSCQAFIDDIGGELVIEAGIAELEIQVGNELLPQIMFGRAQPGVDGDHHRIQLQALDCLGHGDDRGAFPDADFHHDAGLRLVDGARQIGMLGMPALQVGGEAFRRENPSADRGRRTVVSRMRWRVLMALALHQRRCRAASASDCESTATGRDRRAPSPRCGRVMAAVRRCDIVGFIAAGVEIQFRLHRDMEARAAGSARLAAKMHDARPVFSASAAGAGVVMASRPKNGTAMPSRSFWSTSMQSILPAAQLRQHRRAPHCAWRSWCRGR